MRYTHFSRTERLDLSIPLKKGHSLRDIGRALKKDPSSVSREIERNSVNGEYDPRKANHNQRLRCGDFEGDTLSVPRGSLETLAGMVDRKSRYILAKKIARVKYVLTRRKQ